jgi:hypothetical protein
LRPSRVLEGHVFKVGALHFPSRFIITGLPPGMKADAASGTIYGQIAYSAATTKSRTYQVSVRAQNALGIGPAFIVPWRIDPHDGNGLAGTYHGIIERGYNSDGGRVSVTVSKTGTASMVVEQPGSATRRGACILIGRAPDTLPDTYDPPLPEGMTPPIPLTTAVLLGNAAKGTPMPWSRRDCWLALR